VPSNTLVEESREMRFALRIVVTAAALLLSAVIGFGSDSASGGEKKLRVGLVTQTGGVTDPYLRIAFLGLKRAVRELGVEGKVLTPSANEGYIPSFAYFARRNYDLVLGVGFLQAEAFDAAAVKFPGTRFAIAGVPHEALKHRPKNAVGLDFRTEEAGYLAGYLAALVERTRPGRDVVSSVGGIKLPSVDRFIAGYRAGATKANPRITTLHGYSGGFQDTAKCRAVAQNQIDKGSGVVFAVAGACSLGALQAAKASGVYGVGVDNDQSALGSHILTSAVKREDIAVFKTIQALKRGRFSGGSTVLFSLRDGGVRLGRISSGVPRSFITKVREIRRQIVSGKIKAIPTTLK
jgi:basic membrane protein A and related proteins